MDAIDRVVDQWAKEKPELDTEPMAIMGSCSELPNIWKRKSRNYISVMT